MEMFIIRSSSWKIGFLALSYQPRTRQTTLVPVCASFIELDATTALATAPHLAIAIISSTRSATATCNHSGLTDLICKYMPNVLKNEPDG